jgi:hypothetical protein
LSWQILDENVVNQIKKQKQFEDETAKKLTPLFEAAQNPLIKTLIHGLILDTTKHAETYQMLLDLNERGLMGTESKALGKKEIESHLKEEAGMLKLTKDLSEAIQDKNVKQLVLNILEDEQRHHKALTDLLTMLQKKSSEWDAYLYDLITGFP